MSHISRSTSLLTALTATAAMSFVAGPATAQLSNYSQDFESLDRTDPNALAADGWKLFVASVDGIPNDLTYGNFTAGPFPAPNNIASPNISVISDIPSGGDPPAGSQGLVFFSDYGSGLHSDTNDPRGLVLSLFQERIISAGDIGSTVVFDFLAEGNAGPPTGNAITEAFLLTLDPNAGFAATNNLSLVTTTVPDGAPTPGQLVLDLSDPLLEGQILQFGFRNTARDFEGSAVDYDDVSLTVAVPEPSSLALIGLGGMAMLRRRRS